MESLDHLITKSIKSYYKNKLYMPIAFLVILVAVSFVFPIISLLFPKHYLEKNIDLATMYEDGERFATFKLSDLYFTGYSAKWLDRTTGYYYYTMIGTNCVVIMLDPEVCDQGEPYIKDIIIKGEILAKSESMNTLLVNLSRDLSWNADGIISTVSPYMISQPDAIGIAALFFEIVYILTGAYSILSILFYSTFILFPLVSPPIMQLNAYEKDPKDILEEAEEELATLPQLATDDMFITEHYFIETSNYGVAIVPIDEIIWIYKYSTLHKVLWHHFSISYTLHITAGKRHYIKCPKNTKTDIDGVIDYLSEANHNALIGFSEENRIKVAQLQGELIPVSKLVSFLVKRI